jgi:hypothetical protein
MRSSAWIWLFSLIDARVTVSPLLGRKMRLVHISEDSSHDQTTR